MIILTINYEQLELAAFFLESKKTVYFTDLVC